MSNEVAVTTAAPEPQWAAFVALDWADQKHFWRLSEASSQKQEQGELDNTPEAVAAWAADLNVRFGGRPIAVCLEQTRGALVYMLLQFPQLILFPVNPIMAARFREAFYPSGSKGDPCDTEVLLDILLHHRDRLRRLKPDTVETRLLQRLVERVARDVKFDLVFSQHAIAAVTAGRLKRSLGAPVVMNFLDYLTALWRRGRRM